MFISKCNLLINKTSSFWIFTSEEYRLYNAWCILFISATECQQHKQYTGITLHYGKDPNTVVKETVAT